MSNFKDNEFRNLVLGVNNKVTLADGKSVEGINFDNAATTPPLKCVIDELLKVSPYYSSVHRGEGYKSQLSTALYESSKIEVMKFIGANKNFCDIIYVKNCTEAINKLANLLALKNSGSIVISTFMEHHSNDLPWRENFNVKYVDVDNKGVLNLDDLKNKLEEYSGKVILVAVTGASNVTGHKNNIYQIAKLAHSYGAKILVDGAQLIPHSPFSLKNPHDIDYIDFVAFSAHKIYAPFGTGVLLGDKTFFNNCPPDYSGGGTISYVSHNKVTWAPSPDRHEAGSPNVLGAIALSSSIRKLSRVGMRHIEDHEKNLTMYATENLLYIPSVTIYGDYKNYNNKVSIINFNMDGIHHALLAKILSYEFGIAVRSGCFCAHPYMQTLLKLPPDIIEKAMYESKESQPGTVRISFGMYNTFEEIDRFLYAMYRIHTSKEYFIKKYTKRKYNILKKI